jgi:stalled ribosome alternative rescue factor ArfA
MKKKKRKKNPNGVAKALHTPLYRQRVKPSKKKRVPLERDWFDSCPPPFDG